MRAGAGAEAQRREERGLGDADLFVRGRDLAFCGGDVWSPLQQR